MIGLRCRRLAIPSLFAAGGLVAAMAAHAQSSSPVPEADEASSGWLDLLKTVTPTLGPLRWRGDLSTEYSSLWLPGQDTSRTFLQSGNVGGSTFIHQPWFALVGGNLGVVWSNGGGLDGGNAAALNGGGFLTLFPASRFPFEATLTVNDSRASEDRIGADYRSLLVGLRQQYRSDGSNDSSTQYSLRLDRSELSSDTLGKDVLNVAAASVSGRRGAQNFNAGALVSANESRSGQTATNIRRATGTHSYVPAENFSIETLGTYDRQENVQRAGPDALRIAGEYTQLASYATWRPEEDEPLYDPDHPMLFTGGLRLSAIGFETEAASAQLVGVNGSAGASYEINPQTRAGVGISVTQASSELTGARYFGTLNANLAYDPGPFRWGDYSYSWRASGGANGATGGEQERVEAFVQASQQLGRNFAFEGSLLSVSVGQGYAVRYNRREGQGFALNTNAQATWTLVGAATTQTYVALGLSDLRTSGEQETLFQLVNLQLTRQAPVDALSYWSANLTVQGSRQKNEIPVAGSVLSGDTGFRVSAYGSLSYQHRRLFGVPRLGLSVTYTATQAQLQSRAQGDVTASPWTIGDTLDARIEYRIGKLDARLTFRSAYVDGRRNAGAFLRVTRQF